MKTIDTKFRNELTQLINRHSVENIADMPDFMLSEMLCRMIEVIGPHIKQNLDWHGCNSVCHPAAPVAPDVLCAEECLLLQKLREENAGLKHRLNEMILSRNQPKGEG